MNPILEKIILLLPEVLLILASFVIILLNVFSKMDKDYLSPGVRYGFFGLLLLALLAGWNMLSDPKILLGQCLMQTRLILVTKVFVVLLSFPFWGWRRSILYESFVRARLQFSEYTALIFLSILGTFLLLESNGWLTAYLALELQVIPWYIILAYRHDKLTAIEGGIKYFIFGSMASAVFLYGVAFIFGATGQLSLGPIPYTMWGAVGGACVLVAMFLKLATVPFHVWATEVYEGADNVQVGYLATIPFVTFLVFLIRLLKGPFVPMVDFIQDILTWVACLSILVGALGALKQNNLRKLLAYSGFTHLGLVLLVISTMPQLALFYVVFYAIATMGLYFGLSMVYRSANNINLVKDLNGIGALYPFLAFGLGICILSLAGIPPLPGFWTKFKVFLFFIQQEQYAILAIGAVGTLISFYYYLQLIRHIYLTSEEIEHPQSEKYGHSYFKNAILAFIVLVLLQLDRIQNFLEGLIL